MNSNRISTYAAVMAVAFLCATTARVNAMAVDWQTGLNTAITLANGTTGLPMGDLVELGIFNNGMSDAAIIALGANPTAIQSAFRVWDSVTSGPDAAGEIYTVGFEPGAGLFTSNAFLVVFNAPTVGAATQVGVFKGPITGNIYNGDPWLFPASDAANVASFSVDDLSAPNVLIGGFSVGTYSDGGTWFNNPANSLKLAVVSVPEPATYALVGMGLLAACSLRRRRGQP